MTFIKIVLSLCAFSFLSASPAANNIYIQKCTSCHGVNGEQKAMGTSKAIKEMSVEEIEKSVVDYASGKRKSLAFIKSVKEKFVKNHTKEELHELATYIHGLK